MTGTAGNESTDRLGAATGGGRDHVWAYYVGEGDLVDCGAGRDTIHRHEDLHGLETRGCEGIVIRLSG